MVSRVYGAMIEGIEARPIIVEVRRSRGLPGTDIVGLARGAAKESVIRVRAVLSALGLSLGAERLIVNLLPADLPKEASALDLPLAMALLCAGGYFSPQSLAHRLLLTTKRDFSKHPPVGHGLRRKIAASAT